MFHRDRLGCRRGFDFHVFFDQRINAITAALRWWVFRWRKLEPLPELLPRRQSCRHSHHRHFGSARPAAGRTEVEPGVATSRTWLTNGCNAPPQALGTSCIGRIGIAETPLIPAGAIALTAGILDFHASKPATLGTANFSRPAARRARSSALRRARNDVNRLRSSKKPQP